MGYPLKHEFYYIELGLRNVRLLRRMEPGIHPCSQQTLFCKILNEMENIEETAIYYATLLWKRLIGWVKASWKVHS